MKLKQLWKRYCAQRRAPSLDSGPPVKTRKPKPFQPFTRDESIAILDDAIAWLQDETRNALAMPEGLSKARRRAELRGRDKAIVREFECFVKKQRD
jgi:hypothetical protein